MRASRSAYDRQMSSVRSVEALSESDESKVGDRLREQRFDGFAPVGSPYNGQADAEAGPCELCHRRIAAESRRRSAGAFSVNIARADRGAE